MLGITINLDISLPQSSTITYHHMNLHIKVEKNKYKTMGGLNQTHA